MPYTHAAQWKNIYWTSLTLLDFPATILARYSFVPALVLVNIIMISDALINTQFFSEFVGYKVVFKWCLVYVVITTAFISKE